MQNKTIMKLSKGMLISGVLGTSASLLVGAISLYDVAVKVSVIAYEKDLEKVHSIAVEVRELIYSRFDIMKNVLLVGLFSMFLVFGYIIYQSTYEEEREDDNEYCNKEEMDLVDLE